MESCRNQKSVQINQLFCDKVGVVYRTQPYLVEDQVHIMARTAQISKEKQQSVTLRHKGQSIQNISRTMKVSSSAQKPSRAMMKLALMRTATGTEDPELPLLQRISSLELPASEFAAQRNASQSSSHRHISTSTVQRLRESVFMVELLQRNLD